MRRSKLTLRILLVAVAACLLCCPVAQAKKGGNGGGGGGGKGGGEPSYTLTDLLGFPDNGYQSQGILMTNRDEDGNLLVCGDSRLYPEPGMGAVFHPALWRVALDGSFPDSDPQDLGLPTWSRGARVWGLSELGVVATSTSGARYQDPDDTYWDGEKYVARWIFVAYLDVPGWGYLPLPTPEERPNLPYGVRYRNSGINDMNDNHVVIGDYQTLLQVDPDGTKVWDSVAAMWRLDIETGEISMPISLGAFAPRAINKYDVMAGNYLGWPAIAWFEDGALEIRQLDSSDEFRGADVEALNDHPIDDARLTIVGLSRADETGDFTAPDRGFAWRPFDAANRTTILGTLGGQGSVALDVNGSGQIVGWSDTKRNGHQAFIYSGGVMSNLNSMVDVGSNTLQWAKAINDDGDITGFMRIPRPISEQRGFLLRPIEQN